MIIDYFVKDNHEISDGNFNTGLKLLIKVKHLKSSFHLNIMQCKSFFLIYILTFPPDVVARALFLIHF